MISRLSRNKDGRIGGRADVTLCYPGRKPETLTLRLYVGHDGAQIGALFNIRYRPIGEETGIVVLLAHDERNNLAPKPGWLAKIAARDWELFMAALNAAAPTPAIETE